MERRDDGGTAWAAGGSLGTRCIPDATTTARTSSSARAGALVDTRKPAPSCRSEVTRTPSRTGNVLRAAQSARWVTHWSHSKNPSRGSPSGSPGRRFIQVGVLKANESQRKVRQDSPMRPASSTTCVTPRCCRCQLATSPACPPPTITTSTP